uniref:NAD(P)(+)--arginine ADP-ribosyltransferase n=1 Tax=Chelonoidis abingdonii TaxID=106734 RepID=A0A8C0QLH2_CHEAB
VRRVYVTGSFSPASAPLSGLCFPTNEELSMMEDAFDDQYIGCAENMDRTADGKIESEMSQFSLLWENARKKWNSVKTTISPSLPSNFKDEYGIAIVAYTNSTILYNGKTFSTIFNDAVSGAKRSQAASTNNFEFPYFHYYLTRALQCLKGDCDEMNKITVFGRFASSSTNKKEAEKFGTVTVFIIHTCFGVNIQNMSYNPKQKEVLIPVNEIFNVTKREGNNIILQSTKQNCSHFNCSEYWAKQDKYLCGAICCGSIIKVKEKYLFARSRIRSSPHFVINCPVE